VKIIVGLGNPGKKHQKNRHNIGFLVLDEIFGCDELIWEKKFYSLIAKTTYDGHKVLLVKPQTFMNLSGEALNKIVNFYKLNIKNIMVIHDDIYLKFGKIKVKHGGSDAGHNGIKNIDNLLEENEYYRLRYGVGQNTTLDLAEYVLQDFSEEELLEIKKNKAEIEKHIKTFLNNKE
jgi:PTH1 family peptidyl-tRNA hydrolase